MIKDGYYITGYYVTCYIISSYIIYYIIIDEKSPFFPSNGNKPKIGKSGMHGRSISDAHSTSISINQRFGN